MKEVELGERRGRNGGKLPAESPGIFWLPFEFCFCPMFCSFAVCGTHI